MGLSPTSGIGGEGISSTSPAGIGGTGVSKGPSVAPYVGPLDLVPGAFRSFGNRAMSGATINTPIYRLEADSVSQSFNPDAAGDAPIASIEAFGGMNLITADTWYDKSGNGVNYVKNSAPLLPAAPGWDVIAASVRPGIGPRASGVTAAGTSLLKEGGDSALSGAITVLILCYVDEAPSFTTYHINYNLFSAGNAFCQIGIGPDEIFIDMGDDSGENYANWLQNGDYAGLHLFRFVVQANGDAAIFMDGVNLNATNVGGEVSVPIDFVLTDEILKIQEISGEAFVLSAVYEINFYNSALSAPNLALIEPDMQAYYGSPALP